MSGAYVDSDGTVEAIPGGGGGNEIECIADGAVTANRAVQVYKSGANFYAKQAGNTITINSVQAPSGETPLFLHASGDSTPVKISAAQVTKIVDYGVTDKALLMIGGTTSYPSDTTGIYDNRYVVVDINSSTGEMTYSGTIVKDSMYTTYSCDAYQKFLLYSHSDATYAWFLHLGLYSSGAYLCWAIVKVQLSNDAITVAASGSEYIAGNASWYSQGFNPIRIAPKKFGFQCVNTSDNNTFRTYELVDATPTLTQRDVLTLDAYGPNYYHANAVLVGSNQVCVLSYPNAAFKVYNLSYSSDTDFTATAEANTTTTVSNPGLMCKVSSTKAGIFPTSQSYRDYQFMTLGATTITAETEQTHANYFNQWALQTSYQHNGFTKMILLSNGQVVLMTFGQNDGLGSSGTQTFHHKLLLWDVDTANNKMTLADSRMAGPVGRGSYGGQSADIAEIGSNRLVFVGINSTGGSGEIGYNVFDTTNDLLEPETTRVFPAGPSVSTINRLWGDYCVVVENMYEGVIVKVVKFNSDKSVSIGAEKRHLTSLASTSTNTRAGWEIKQIGHGGPLSEANSEFVVTYSDYYNYCKAVAFDFNTTTLAIGTAGTPVVVGGSSYAPRYANAGGLESWVNFQNPGDDGNGYHFAGYSSGNRYYYKAARTGAKSFSVSLQSLASQFAAAAYGLYYYGDDGTYWNYILPSSGGFMRIYVTKSNGTLNHADYTDGNLSGWNAFWIIRNTKTSPTAVSVFVSGGSLYRSENGFSLEAKTQPSVSAHYGFGYRDSAFVGFNGSSRYLYEYDTSTYVINTRKTESDSTNPNVYWKANNTFINYLSPIFETSHGYTILFSPYGAYPMIVSDVDGVYNLGSVNGIAKAGAADGAALTAVMKYGLAGGFSGLTIGGLVYAQNDGQVTNSANGSAIGRSITTDNVLIGDTAA